MATLNYAFKEITCKIVFYGCGLCGKTTNLQFIHNSVPQKFRGDLVSLATEQDRTLFFDFLPLDLGEVKGFKTKFQLYTVPGQVYYNATRKLVLRGVDGIVFVVDSQRDRLQENLDSLQNLKDNLQEYGYSLDEIPWILQYNKRDMPEVMELAEAEAKINAAKVPSVEAVATTGQGVRETLKMISGMVIRNLSQDRTSAPSGTKAGAPAPLAASAPAIPALPGKPARPAAAAAAEESRAPETPKAKVRVETVRSTAGEEAPAEEKKAAPKVIPLETTQKCDVRWRSFRVGGGQLTLSTRKNGDGRGEYQLSGLLSFLVMNKTWARLLSFKVREKRKFEGEDVDFIRLESSSADEGPVLTVWVKDSIEKQMYIYYEGWGGPIRVLPEGKTQTP